MDAIQELADQRLREIAIDLEVQLERGTGMRPVAWLLAQARAKASKAIVLLLDADADDAKLIRRLQAEMKLYDDMVTACQSLIREGKDADYRIAESERSDLNEMVMEMTDEQRRLHRLEPRGKD